MIPGASQRELIALDLFAHFFNFKESTLRWELTKLTLLSMTSLSLLRSSRAVSQFCMRISDPSFPQRAFKVFLSSLPGTCTETKHHWLDKTLYWHNLTCMSTRLNWGTLNRTHKHTIKVQILCSTRVVSTFILKFCIFVQCVQHFRLDLQKKNTQNCLHCIYSNCFTPAFGVTCIGEIFVHLSTCHLSTCYLNGCLTVKQAIFHIIRGRNDK